MRHRAAGTAAERVEEEGSQEHVRPEVVRKERYARETLKPDHARAVRAEVRDVADKQEDDEDAIPNECEHAREVHARAALGTLSVDWSPDDVHLLR
jgi:hypothetical protein